MIVRVEYTRKAIKQLQKLDILISKRIYKKIEFYSKQKDPLEHASHLKSPFDDLYKFRIGEYRVIFEVDSTGKILLLTIMKIGHRRDVYV